MVAWNSEAFERWLTTDPANQPGFKTGGYDDYDPNSVENMPEPEDPKTYGRYVLLSKYMESDLAIFRAKMENTTPHIINIGSGTGQISTVIKCCSCPFQADDVEYEWQDSNGDVYFVGKSLENLRDFLVIHNGGVLA